MYCAHFQAENLMLKEIMTCPTESWPGSKWCACAHKAAQLASAPCSVLFSIVCGVSSRATCGQLSPDEVRPRMWMARPRPCSTARALAFSLSALSLTLCSMVVAKEPLTLTSCTWDGNLCNICHSVIQK